MRVLTINKYHYRRAGAEIVALDTAEMLRARGHESIWFSMAHTKNLPTDFSRYFVSNVDYDVPGGLGKKLKAAGRLLYSFEARRKLGQLLREHGADIAHLHNIYHQLSPSVLHTLRKHRIPIVLTLHDYKIVCASYSMRAKGKVCEACRGGRYFQCTVRTCVKDSLAKSLLNTVEMYLHHKLMHLYDLVHIYISSSRFLMDKIIEMGFNSRVVHLPNFVRTESYVPHFGGKNKVICYAGRLAPSKGLDSLLTAVKGLDVRLRIIGDGPSRDVLRERVRREGLRNVTFLGYLTGEALQEEICSSMFTVLPSEWYENNPRSVIESFALGKPVIGSRIGGIPELVRDGETGYTFTAFDALDLREKIERLAGDPATAEEMGRRARRLVEQELNEDFHYRRLMEIYNSIMS